jgi:hypothetical protein
MKVGTISFPDMTEKTEKKGQKISPKVGQREEGRG